MAERAATEEIVRISRRNGFNRRPLDAFVVGVSGGRSGLSLLMPLRDRIDLDGYDVLRNCDISRAELCPKQNFYDRALQQKKQRPSAPKRIAFGTIAELLKTVSDAYGLVVINRELVNRGAVEIGSMKWVGRRQYQIEWVTPTAEVEEDRKKYDLRDVTKVQFGGAYEQTLAELVRHDV